MRFYLFLFIVFAASTINQLMGQETIRGYVYTLSENNKLTALPGVHIKLLEENTGTVSSTTGYFSVDTQLPNPQVTFSFIGFKTDTLTYSSTDTLRIVLQEGSILDDVEIIFEKGDYYLSKVDPINAHTMGQGELRKAACCSLAESFETNPSIDANYADAITGTKQIRMLGLSGKYVQIMQDNIPSVRGLTSVYGLDYIPGAWINSIQVSKGAGSVVNGFESTTGQINIEMKKPGNSERLHLNLFGSAQGRLEANIYLDHPIKKHWESTLLLHGKNQQFEFDQNKDNFLDQPLVNHLIVRNEWKYSKNNIRMTYGVGGLITDSRAGTLLNQSNIPSYQVNSKAQQINSYAKIGYLFPDNDNKSLAIQLAGSYYNYEGDFSGQEYLGTQTSGYINTIFQNKINENQTFKTGISGNYDHYKETIDLDTNERANFLLEEQVLGGYFEHTLNKNRFSLISGLRADYNFVYGAFLTPRLHGRYNLSEKTTAKFAVGNGTRTPNVIMENIGLMASSRKWIINNENNSPRYGLQQEKAWNFGLGINQEFKLNRRNGSIQLDVYRTEFTNQVVIDLEQSTQTVSVYNLDGQSFANSLQAEVNYQLNKRLDIRLAYRYLAVKTTYQTGLQSLPFVAKNRAFTSLSYSSRKNKKGSLWKGELTAQWIGQQRIPSTQSNPIQYQLSDNAPDYFLINSQVTRIFNQHFEVYLGGENLTNFKQENPIVQVNNPNGNYFDSSLIWGPIMGSNYYIGLRWTVQ